MESFGSTIVRMNSATTRILTFDAVDTDGLEKNLTQYFISSSKFYASPNSNPRDIGAFRVVGNGLYTHLDSYKEFSGGVFVLDVTALDSLDSSLFDQQQISVRTLFIHRKYPN